ncbi:hypothetical protein N9917_00975 [Deltaproteobacteria bacterium]|nr:hypothetical protein [Deltaproteobacteria bacterium]
MTDGFDYEWAQKMFDAPWKPQKMLMHVDDFKDLLVYALLEEGMSAEDAEAEATRRISELGTDEDPGDALMSPEV